MNTNEIERTAEFSNGFYRVGLNNLANGFLGILLSPFIALIVLLCMPLAIFLLNRANRKFKVFIHDFRQRSIDSSLDNFQALKLLEADLNAMEKKHRGTFDDISELEGWIFSWFVKRIAMLSAHLKEAIEMVESRLYVDASQMDLSEEVQQDLSDFFGSDEGYQEDTFIQLNPQ